MGCDIIGKFVFDNATPETVEALAAIPMPNATVTDGCRCCDDAITSDGTNFTINRPGEYSIDANFTFVGTAAGNLEVQMYRNGNPEPGMHAFYTFTAEGDYASSGLSTVIRIPRSVPMATINFKPQQAASVRVAGVTIKRLNRF